MLFRGEHALEVERPDMLRVEAQDARERDRRICAAPTLVQRLAERRQCVKVVRVTLEQLDQQRDGIL